MIQIFGERNSCNNYLVKLIDKNLRIEAKKSHQFPQYISGKNTIILTKNPYAWLLSLHKKPHGSHNFRSKYIYLSFEEFIRSQWGSYENAVYRYNDIMTSYINFLESTPQTYLLKSEDLQQTPGEVLSDIAETFGIKQRGFRNIEREVNSGGNLVEKFTKLDYYKNEEWKQELRKEDIKWINSIIDKRVFEYFDYKRL